MTTRDLCIIATQIGLQYSTEKLQLWIAAPPQTENSVSSFQKLETPEAAFVRADCLSYLWEDAADRPDANCE